MKCSHLLSALLLLGVAIQPSVHAEKAKSHKCKKAKASHACVIRQKDLPLVITRSGHYVFEKNIHYKGSGSAITIAANDVKVNLKSYSLTLDHPDATGIKVSDVSEIIIEGDAIIHKSCHNQTGHGIHVSHANKVLLKDIFTINHHSGLLIEHSIDVNVVQSQFLDPAHAGAHVINSTNVQFDGCTFAGSANNGLLFSSANQDCRLVNSNFPDAQFSNLLVQQMSGMMVDNCSFTNVGGDPGKANLVQFGDVFTPQQVAIDVTFRNCTIVNRPDLGGNTAPEGLGLYNVSGVLVDSCIVDIDNTGQDPTLDLSAIHIGNGSGVQVGSNVTIRNTISEGPATDGFYPDIGSSNILMDSCLVSNALKDGIFLAGSSACVVQNCTVVNNGTNGIFIGEVSSNNAVLNNVVIQNGFNIISPPSLPPTGNGIAIQGDGSSFNLIQNNQVFRNAVENIDDDGTSDVVVDNTTF